MTDVLIQTAMPYSSNLSICLPFNLSVYLMLTSPSCSSLVKWIEDGVPTDPFLNPELMKNNPWVEKGKCVII